MECAQILEILNLAREAGANDARIVYSNAIQNSFSAFNDKIDKIHSACDNAITFSLFVDGKYGSFTTNKLEKDDLRKFLKNSVSLVSLIEEDPYRKLPPKELYYQGGGKDLLLADSSYFEISPEIKKSIALNAVEEVKQIAKDKYVGAEASFDDSRYVTIIADTQGFIAKDIATSFALSASASLCDTDGSFPESYWYERAIFFNDLNIKGCGTLAAQRGIESLNPQKIKAGKYNVVIENRVASKIIMPILNALDGASIDQNNSFLNGTLGKKVFSDLLTITDDPHLEKAFGACYFDLEGIATKPSTIIEKGIICKYFIDTYYSSKLNMPINSGDFSVLRLTPTETNLTKQNIIDRLGDGVLITGFNGGNYNHVTGDFSFGIRGFYFEKGEILHSIREMNITGNIIDFCNTLLAVGDDSLQISASRIPTLAFGCGNLA